MANDVNIRIRVISELEAKLRAARAELAALKADSSVDKLSSSLGGATRGAADVAAGMRNVKTETVAAKSAVSELTAGLRLGIAGGIASFFAVNAIVNFTRETARAAIQFEKTAATLKFATGSAIEASRGYEFARREAERLGLEVGSTAEAYAKFAAAAKGTAISARDVDVVFTGVAEASRALGLSSEQTANAIRALVQMLSKGKITAEEFRGQLGDALPGAAKLAADALGVTTVEFSRMLDAGELTLDLIPKLGRAFHDQFGGVATEAARGLGAEMARLSNAWTELQLAFAQKGGIQVAIGAMQALAAVASGLGRILDHLGQFSTAQRIVDEAAAEAARRRSIANLVPGAGGVLPGGAIPPILGAPEPNFEGRLAARERAAQAAEKAEVAAHRNALARTKELELAAAQAADARLREQKEIARLQDQGFADQLDQIAEEQRAWQGSLDAVGQAIKEQREEQIRASEEASREVEALWRDTTSAISHALTDAIFRGFENGKGFMQNFADTMLNLFKTLALQLVQGVIFQAVGGLVAAGIGAFGAFSGGGVGRTAGGAGGAGGVGGALSLLGTGSSLSSAFGGPSLTSFISPAINSFGASTGLFGQAASASFVGPPAPGILGPATLGSTLGAAGLSAAGGGLISGLMGGNTTVGTAAGGVLGAGGFMLGAQLGSAGGPIGAIIGAIIGGILGGVIKQTPPRGFQVSGLSGTLSEGGKKGFDPKSLDPLSKQIRGAILAFDKDLGLGLVKERVKFWIGFKEGKGFRTTVAGQGDQDFTDPNEVVRLIIRQQVGKQVGNVDDPGLRFIGQTALAGGSAELMLTRLKAGVELRKRLRGLVDLDQREFERVIGAVIEHDSPKKILSVLEERVALISEIKEFLRLPDAGQNALIEQIRAMDRVRKQLGQTFRRLRADAKLIGADVGELESAFAKHKDLLHEERKKFRTSVRARAFELAGEEVPLSIRRAAILEEFAELRKVFKLLGLSVKELAELQAKALKKLKPAVAAVDSAGFIGFLLPGGVISRDRTDERFAATGLNRLFTRPTRLNVAETGPEFVSVTPPGVPQNAGNQRPVVVQVNGPTIFSDLTMDKFARQIDRAMRGRALRFG